MFITFCFDIFISLVILGSFVILLCTFRVIKFSIIKSEKKKSSYFEQSVFLSLFIIFISADNNFQYDLYVVLFL